MFTALVGRRKGPKASEKGSTSTPKKTHIETYYEEPPPTSDGEPGISKYDRTPPKSIRGQIVHPYTYGESPSQSIGGGTLLDPSKYGEPLPQTEHERELGLFIYGNPPLQSSGGRVLLVNQSKYEETPPQSNGGRVLTNPPKYEEAPSESNDGRRLNPSKHEEAPPQSSSGRVLLNQSKRPGHQATASYDPHLIYALSNMIGSHIVVSLRSGARYEGPVATVDSEDATLTIGNVLMGGRNGYRSPLVISLSGIASWYPAETIAISDDWSVLEEKPKSVDFSNARTLPRNQTEQTKSPLQTTFPEITKSAIANAAVAPVSTAVTRPVTKARPEKVMIDPKSLSGDEKQRRAQRKKAMNSAEMQKRKADLLKFSSSFKLSEPIPEDLIPILAKDETKQTAIREKHTVRPTTRALDRDRTKADLLAFSNNSKLSEPMEVDLTDTSLDVRDRTSSDATSPQNSTTDTNVPPRGQSPSEPSAGEETYIDEEDQSVPPTNETPPGETPKGMDMWERQNDEEPMLKADSQVAAQVNIGANADTDTEKKAEDVSPKTPPLQKEEQEIYLDTKRAEEIAQVVHLPPSAGPTLSTNPQSFEGNGIDNENPRSAPQIQKEELTFRKRIFDGNYSDVHCAEWQGQMVAVKVIRSLKLSAEAMNRKRKRELDTWWELRHPSVLPLLGFIEDIEPMGALGAMVSPYYVNGSAADYFARATLTYYNKLTLWLEVLQGMAYLHGYYPIIVHGDLKPQNILIDDTGHARICDFGLARLILERGSTGLTTTTAHAGTDRYKAPELVIKPNAKPTVASDVYALGCIGLEFALSQRPYWQHSVVWKILEDIRGGKPPASRPRDLSPEIGYFWDQLQACWDEEPTERPTTTSLCYYISNYSISLADELEKAQDQESQ